MRFCVEAFAASAFFTSDLRAAGETREQALSEKSPSELSRSSDGARGPLRAVHVARVVARESALKAALARSRHSADGRGEGGIRELANWRAREGPLRKCREAQLARPVAKGGVEEVEERAQLIRLD